MATKKKPALISSDAAAEQLGVSISQFRRITMGREPDDVQEYTINARSEVVKAEKLLHDLLAV